MRENDIIPYEWEKTHVVNTIQRALVKCAARFGLGIAIYGAADFDDLPSEEEHQQKIIELFGRQRTNDIRGTGRDLNG